MISDKAKFILAASFVLLFVECAVKKAHAQTASKMYGEIGLTSNYVDRGITQSDKKPSISAGFGYWFGTQGRIGFDSASVKFPDENANLEARIFGGYKFLFTPNADLRIRNDLVRYLTEDKRNKTQIFLDQNFFGYHILLSREDNFEGTKTPRNWFAFQKDWPVNPNTFINTTVGYSMVQDFDSYFDALIGLNYRADNLTFSLSGTYVSNASQFNGAADPAVILTLMTHF